MFGSNIVKRFLHAFSYLHLAGVFSVLLISNLTMRHVYKKRWTIEDRLQNVYNNIRIKTLVFFDKVKVKLNLKRTSLDNVSQMFDLIKNLGPGDHYDVYDQLEAMLLRDPGLAVQTASSLIDQAIDSRQDALVELLLRYGAQIMTHAIVVEDDRRVEYSLDLIRPPILMGCDYSLVAKIITPDAVLLPTSDLCIRALALKLRAKYHLPDRYDNPLLEQEEQEEQEEMEPIVRQIHAVAKAFSPYYQQLRTYYTERGAFLGVCKSIHEELSKIPARSLPDKVSNGPLLVIFSFLKPRKQPFVNAARAAVDAEIASAPGTPRYVIV